MAKYKHNEGYIEESYGKDRGLEHRRIMEQFLRRKLQLGEVVHHINGDKKDNCVTNLKVMSNSEHAKLHARKTKFRSVICCVCNNKYVTLERYYKRKKKINQKFMCSKRCVGLNSVKYFINKSKLKYDPLIKKCLKKGMTGYAISKKYGLNRKTVYNHIKAFV